MLLQAGVNRPRSASMSPRPPSGERRNGSRPLSGERRGSSRGTSDERRDSSRPQSGGHLSLSDWHEARDASGTTPGGSIPSRPNSAASAASRSSNLRRPKPQDGPWWREYLGRGVTLPGSDPSTRLRPQTAREFRPWMRHTPSGPDRVQLGTRLLDLGAACNRLVAEITERCCRVSRDTNWPCAEVYVWFGSNPLPLPMTVLFGSAATRMKQSELGARLMAHARTGLGENELRMLCVKLAYPILEKQGPNQYLPILPSLHTAVTA